MIMRKAWAWMSKRETSSMVSETGLLAGGVLDMGYLILLLPLSVNHWSLASHDSTPHLSPLGPETHTPRPTTGTAAEYDLLDYYSYRAHALGTPNLRVGSSGRHFTIMDGSTPPIKAKHSAHLVEDDSAEEYSAYRNRALSHQRAPSTHIRQLSLTVAPRHTLRPCYPPLLPPRAWEVGTPYSSPRALTPPLESGPPLGTPHEPLFAHPIAKIGTQELFTSASAKSAILLDILPAGASYRPSAGADISALSAPRIIHSSGSSLVPETPILVDSQPLWTSMWTPLLNSRTHSPPGTILWSGREEPSSDYLSSQRPDSDKDIVPVVSADDIFHRDHLRPALADPSSTPPEEEESPPVLSSLSYPGPHPVSETPTPVCLSPIASLPACTSCDIFPELLLPASPAFTATYCTSWDGNTLPDIHAIFPESGSSSITTNSAAILVDTPLLWTPLQSDRMGSSTTSPSPPHRDLDIDTGCVSTADIHRCTQLCPTADGPMRVFDPPTGATPPPYHCPALDSFLALLLSYRYLSLPIWRRHVPGLLPHRLKPNSPPDYNKTIPGSITHRLQEAHYHLKYFRPPGYQDLRTAKKPISGQPQSSILSLCRLLTLVISSPGYDSPSLLGSSPMHQVTQLALPSGYTLCTGLAHTKGGGRPKAPKRSRSPFPDSPIDTSKKKQKNRLLPGASSPRRRSSKSERSPEPRLTPVSRSTKRCLSQDEISSVSSF